MSEPSAQSELAREPSTRWTTTDDLAAVQGEPDPAALSAMLWGLFPAQVIQTLAVPDALGERLREALPEPGQSVR